MNPAVPAINNVSRDKERKIDKPKARPFLVADEHHVRLVKMTDGALG
jgi:hypothetical protein